MNRGRGYLFIKGTLSPYDLLSHKIPQSIGIEILNSKKCLIGEA
jgi:hypothetical protein